MAQQTIDIGTVANDGTGDTLRDAFGKVNDNFDELYTLLVIGFVDTTTDHTLALTDTRKKIRVNSGTGKNVTIPLNSSVAFPLGTVILLQQKGAGTVTVVATGGVTLNSRGALVALAGQYAEAMLTKEDTNTWVLAGDLA